jgi:hypothetical protein
MKGIHAAAHQQSIAALLTLDRQRRGAPSPARRAVRQHRGGDRQCHCLGGAVWGSPSRLRSDWSRRLDQGWQLAHLPDAGGAALRAPRLKHAGPWVSGRVLPTENPRGRRGFSGAAAASPHRASPNGALMGVEGADALLQRCSWVDGKRSRAQQMITRRRLCPPLPWSPAAAAGSACGRA